MLKELVWQSLSAVHDPEIRKPITDLEMIELRSVSSAGEVSAQLKLTVHGCPAAKSIERAVREAITKTAGVTSLELSVTVMTPDERNRLIQQIRPQRGMQFAPGTLTRIIAVSSGKGGVGKSSITASLALELSASGYRVGLIDADIFGFSIPLLMGLVDSDGRTVSPTRVGNMIMPPLANGVSTISIGMFLGDKAAQETAVSWRGPMLHRTLEQFLRDVYFGDLDYLLVDLPPGTGDIALSFGQLLPHAEVLVVTTPQTSAASVAVRSGLLAHQNGQTVIGVVENLSSMRLPDNSLIHPFGTGGGELVAQNLNSAFAKTSPEFAPVGLLTQIPFSEAYRRALDNKGLATFNSQADPAAVAIKQLASKIVARGRNLSNKQLPLQPR
ncbi:ATP-binding protein [Canibacter sp. lx-45]|uniref:Mrp/NBP35 family ATP-binding protein n=1 Tax=Canibacter zhuwentaonis TaxID=2837491 RepID=UPI001BDD1E5B|nr:Mrp/NBP35 family ATP-binding protein [Canibacter zhuwentaonis]MBT1034970.1 ATP-binding protein [Canibacter zhuwentaonis]